MYRDVPDKLNRFKFIGSVKGIEQVSIKGIRESTC